jgi:uncharacterized protein (DUF305 family)
MTVVKNRLDVELEESILGRLGSIGDALRAAERESKLLAATLKWGKNHDAPGLVESDCTRLRNSIADALAYQNSAADVLARHIRDGGPADDHWHHKSALEMAHEFCGQSKPRAVRGLAKQILSEAGVPKAEWGSEKSVTNWLANIRSAGT